MPLDSTSHRAVLPPLEQPLLAYSYIRFSTGRQRFGRSMKRQLEMAEAFAAQHGRRLDTSLKMADLGLSAFAGANRTKGGLGVFLAAVRSRKVPAGSWLIIESLDRLSRDKPMESVDLISELTTAGITVITLADTGATFFSRRSLNEGLLTKLIGELERAHNESKRKSGLLLDAWGEKKALARSDKTPLSKTCPAWLRLSADRSRYEVIPSRGLIVKQIYRWSIEGWGKELIVKTLNREIKTFPVMDKAGQGIDTKVVANGWHESHITKILGNPAVLGFSQMHLKNTETKGRQQPEGEIISGYFEPVIDQLTFDREIAARAGRKGTGKRGEQQRNMFSGLCVCLACGSPMRMRSKGNRWPGAQHRSEWQEVWNAGDRLICTAADRRVGCDRTNSTAYPQFEAAVLDRLASLLLIDHDARAGPRETDLRSQIATIQAEIVRQQNGMTRALGRFMDDDDATIQGFVNECRETIKRLKGTLHELSVSLAQNTTVLSATDQHALVEALRADVTNHDPAVRLPARIALTQTLRGLINGIGCDGADLATVKLFDGRMYVGIAHGAHVFSVQMQNGGMSVIAKANDYKLDGVAQHIERLSGMRSDNQPNLSKAEYLRFAISQCMPDPHPMAQVQRDEEDGNYAG